MKGIIIIFSVLIVTSIYADTIYLKNGRVIEDAKVIKIDEEKKIVVIEAYGGTTELNMLELDRIEQSDEPGEIKEKSSIAENEEIVKSKDSLGDFYQKLYSLLRDYQVFHSESRETYEYFLKTQDPIGSSIRLTEINTNLINLNTQLNTLALPQNEETKDIYNSIIDIIKLNIEINEKFKQLLRGEDVDMQEYLSLITEHSLAITKANNLIKTLATEKMISEFGMLLNSIKTNEILTPEEEKVEEILSATKMDIPKNVEKEIKKYIFNECRKLGINLYGDISFWQRKKTSFPGKTSDVGYTIIIKPLKRDNLFYNIENICKITSEINDSYNLDLERMVVIYGESLEGEGTFVHIFLSDIRDYLRKQISRKEFISKWFYPDLSIMSEKQKRVVKDLTEM